MPSPYKKRYREFEAAAEPEPQPESDSSASQEKGDAQQAQKRKRTEADKLGDALTPEIDMPAKRKRTVPTIELRLQDWLEEHLEEKEESDVSKIILYDNYLAACIDKNFQAVEQNDFNRFVKQKFPKGVAVKETSPFHSLVKEKKLKPKKKRVQAETLGMKMKDIIERALTDSSNPKTGVRFHTLKTMIATKYPALRIDLRPKILKTALERGVRYGHLILVKGIGACGYYRLPSDDAEEEEEEKEKADKSEEKENAEKNGDGEEGEEGEEKGEKEEGKEKDADEEEEGVEDDKKKASKRGPKKKKKGKKDEEEKEEEKEEVKEEEKEKGDKKKKKSKSKKKKKPKPESWEGGQKAKIEDTFPLAMTFMVEPKESSVGKIKKYIQNWYPEADVDGKLKKVLAKGVDKGYWEQISGSAGGSGSYRLLIDEFDPSSDKDFDEMICNAIIASHEPKQASANLIKKYVMEFHPEFKVDARPFLFKKALERAAARDQIRQLSGLGATGTFQLSKTYIPSPAKLAGGEDEEVPEADNETDNEYNPRPTKSRGKGKGRKAQKEEPEGLDDYKDPYKPRKGRLVLVGNTRRRR